ncbi:PucR family transcriptional regulator [Dactylosporangium sp. CS-047395]|uniref:PucR family transcriptional regulator n=1 Tax=Dactylosporangium sp. CS-047395 TaxID=3239936 RepID=UPI003D8FFA93
MNRPVERLAGELARRTETLADGVIARIFANIPTYAVVPRKDLEVSIGQIVEDVCAVLRTGQVPPPPDITQAEESSQARARQGVPIHDIMQAFRFTMGGVRDTVLAIAGEAGLPAARTVRLTTLLWSYSDAYTANVVSVYRLSDIEGALERARRAQTFLQGLVDDSLSDADLATAGAVLGLDPAARYRTLLARPDRGDVGRVLRELQHQASRRPGAAVLATIGPRCLGVLAFRPEPLLDDAVVALGPPARPAALARSFRSAGAVLTAAGALGLHGVFTLEDLSWRAVAAGAGEVNELLRERYLAPLEAQGAFGTMVLDSVAAYLACDRNIPRAARSIPVHVNTLRYRLRRFEELTGASLDSTDTIVEVSFALRIAAPMRAPRNP